VIWDSCRLLCMVLQYVFPHPHPGLKTEESKRFGQRAIGTDAVGEHEKAEALEAVVAMLRLTHTLC
jgi:hypothetical protein